MNNKSLYINEAERIYVYELRSVEETAAKVNVCPRTIIKWKLKGDWDTKRRQFLKSKQSFHEELYDFARKIMHEIKADLENGEKIDTGRMYAFTKMLPLITKIKEYEDVAALMKNKPQENKGLTKDIIKTIEEEILGMKSNESE